MILQERLHSALEELGCTRIPEILHQHAEEASKHNISYLDFFGQAFARGTRGQT